MHVSFILRFLYSIRFHSCTADLNTSDIDLNKSFPLVHKHLKRETVNTFALIYTFEGTDKSLKPLMLTGHQGELSFV